LVVAVVLALAALSELLTGFVGAGDLVTAAGFVVVAGWVTAAAGFTGVVAVVGSGSETGVIAVVGSGIGLATVLEMYVSSPPSIFSNRTS
jgi:hypothetical protein